MRCQLVVVPLILLIAVGTNAAKPLENVAPYMRLPKSTQQLQLSRIQQAEARRRELSLYRMGSEVNILASTRAACVPDQEPPIRFTPNQLVPTAEGVSGCQKMVNLRVLQCTPDRSGLQVLSQLDKVVGIYRLSWLENVSQACSAVYQKASS